MKKLAVLAMATVIGASFTMAALAANEPVTIAKVSGIKVDGKLDDWKAAGIKPIHVAGDEFAGDAPGVADNSFDFYVGHDGKMIYTYFDVVTPVVSFWQDLGSVWNQTGAEIFFGGVQYGMGIDPDGNAGFAWKDGGKDIKIEKTAKGWALECSFSMADINDNYGDLAGTTLAPGAAMQFSFGVDITDSEGGTRTGQLYFPIDWAWNQPDTFATATLAK